MKGVECWKVVRVARDGRRVTRKSYVVHFGSLTYKKGIYTNAEFGGILVFNAPKNARAMVASWKGHELWKVKAYEQVELPLFNGNISNLSSMKKVWKKGGQGYPWNNWPKGTLAFKRIKLIERVK